MLQRLKGGNRPRSHSTGQHQESTNPVCSICQSEEFYEDDQGGMICVACGTQSQDFLAEGFDEDDLGVYGGGAGNMISLRNAPSDKSNRNSSDNDSRHSKLDEIPDSLEVLKLYQFCLQMIFDTALIASEVLVDGVEATSKGSSSSSSNGRKSASDSSNAMAEIYRNTLKTIWMDYLQAWNIYSNSTSPVETTTEINGSKRKRSSFHRQRRKCDIAQGFTRSTKRVCRCHWLGNSPAVASSKVNAANSKNVGDAGAGRAGAGMVPSAVLQHPLFPTKQLLLGFVYATFRVMRSPVLPADIVRWCEEGTIPYANLWESIPMRWRSSVQVSMKWLFDAPASGARQFVNPSTVLFFACELAKYIRVEVFPPGIGNSSASSGAGAVAGTKKRRKTKRRKSIAEEETDETDEQNTDDEGAGAGTGVGSDTGTGVAARSGVLLPALNGPLVAFRMISRLGLPAVVWAQYCSIVQLFTPWCPLVGAGVLDQHHPEHIMAVIVMAVKCCPHWMTWSLFRSPLLKTSTRNSASASASTGASIGTGISAAGMGTEKGAREITRAQLPGLLAAIRRNNPLHSLQPDVSRQPFQLNPAGK
jgi:hypothetical protein